MSVAERLEKLWVVNEPDPEAVLGIASALNVSEPAAKLLVARGFLTPAAALDFLNADFDSLENPFKLADMERAVMRLRIAIARKEKVFVAGDRDADGVTSTALLIALLETLGLTCSWKVPSPEDGYGLSLAAIDEAAKFGASLVLAVDCGIRDFAGVDHARTKSIDVIVLDHHEPAETLPSAFAVVDPKRADCPYPFKGLSGCGVAFKFAQAALMAEDQDFFAKEIVVFDTETTGMSPGKNRMIEIAAVKSRNGVERGRFDSLIRCDEPIPPMMTKVHGISDAMLADAPDEEEVIGKFLEFAGDATLVAHKASFDIGFLTESAKRIFGKSISNPVIDTLGEARVEFPGADCSLGALTEKLGILHDTKHRALSDVLATFGLYRRLVSRRNVKLQAFLKSQLDIVAISTLADVVPLVGENRVLVKRGIEAFRKSTRPGIVALRDALIRGDSVSAKDIAWSVVPVINSAGRMGNAATAARLLMEKDPVIARELVAELSAMNTLRKERVKTNLDAVTALLADSFDPENDPIVFVTVKDIEHGVTGIVANRLMNEVGRPVIILIDDGSGIAAGTSRSIEGFDITAALEKAAHLLERFGGHGGAAGLSLKVENIPLLKEHLTALVKSEMAPEALQPKIRIDAEIRAEDVCERFIDEIAMLEPTGHGNEMPIFCVRDVEVAEARRMGADGQHLKLVLRTGEASFESVAWNCAGVEPPLPGDRINICFSMEKNIWAGKTRVQCLLEDFRRVQ